MNEPKFKKGEMACLYRTPQHRSVEADPKDNMFDVMVVSVSKSYVTIKEGIKFDTSNLIHESYLSEADCLNNCLFESREKALEYFSKMALIRSLYFERALLYKLSLEELNDLNKILNKVRV